MNELAILKWRQGWEYAICSSPLISIVGTTIVVSRTMSSFNPLYLTLCLSPLLTPPFTSMVFLLVEVCALMVFHLHPILCTWDAVTTCTPVTIFFPHGVRLYKYHFCVWTRNVTLMLLGHLDPDSDLDDLPPVYMSSSQNYFFSTLKAIVPYWH